MTLALPSAMPAGSLSASVPDWARTLGGLDLSRLTAEFIARIHPDPRLAVSFWEAVSLVIPAPLRLAWGRLVDARLDLSSRVALLTCKEGHRFLFQRLVEGARRPTFPPEPWFSPALSHDNYCSLVMGLGSDAARQSLLKGEVILLGLRRETSTLANHGLGAYDDHIVVLNGLGARHRASVFPACTEPGAQYSQRASFKTVKPAVAATPGKPAQAAVKARFDARYSGVTFKKSEGNDIDGDGIRDLGRLLAGTYQYFEKPDGHLHARAFRVKITQRSERDTDGDGYFNSQDPSRIDPSGVGTTMYIHQGGLDNLKAPNTWSAGCQTIPGNVYKRFLAALGAATSFYYVLIDTVIA